MAQGGRGALATGQGVGAWVRVRGSYGCLLFLNLSGLKLGVLLVCLLLHGIKRKQPHAVNQRPCPLPWGLCGRWRNLGPPKARLQSAETGLAPRLPGRHTLGPQPEVALGSEAWPHRLHECSPGPSLLCPRGRRRTFLPQPPIYLCALNFISRSHTPQRSNNRNENRGSVAKIRVYFSPISS